MLLCVLPCPSQVIENYKGKINWKMFLRVKNNFKPLFVVTIKLTENDIKYKYTA